MKTSLTGIQASGVPHLGNYLGAFRPALRLQDDSTYRTFYFIADYHALTSVRDPSALRQSVIDVAASWLACGLDDRKTVIYRQSDVPEVFELMWLLSCVTATGQLERGVSYKDALAKGDAPNAGIFNYPVLMAADILLYGANVVPVGRDQLQHLELTRDIAERVNHLFGDDLLVVPEPMITEAPLVPGTDGHKMSKSRGNGIPIFAPPKKLRKAVMSIKTSSEELDEPKDPDRSTVFQLYKLVASTPAAEEMAEKLKKGGYGWGHAKEDLYQALEIELAPKRERYETLRSKPEVVDRILAEGADKARVIARGTMERVRKAIGIGRVAAKRDRTEKKTLKLKKSE